MEALTPQFWRDEPEFSSEQLFKLVQIVRDAEARARKPYLKVIEDFRHRIARTKLEADLTWKLVTALRNLGRTPLSAA